MMDGWLLAGDENAITITKDKLTIRFDIVVRTKKGALF